MPFWYVIVSLKYFGYIAGKNIHYKGKITMRGLPGDVTLFTLSRTEVTASRLRKLWQRPAREQRGWPGKSGSFPPILQRQRDVRGRWPFPANQREIRGEERTPPSTSAQAVMTFPCLCWLVAVWRYLYPLWQKTGIHRLIFCIWMEKTNPRASWVKFVYHPLHFE